MVKEEIHHVREGKHGARSTKQAIAIGLSKARKAGVDLKPRRKGRTPRLRREGAEIIYRADASRIERRQAPGEKVDGIDVIVGGHSQNNYCVQS